MRYLLRRKHIVLLGVILCLAALVSAGLWLLVGLPSSEIDPSRLTQPSIRIIDRKGRLLYDSLPTQGGRHILIPLDQIPKVVQQATIATEDSTFYQNPGVDLWGVIRAAWIDISGGETLAGGSTITQQVARNLLMSDQERAERSIRRKLREVILAWELNTKYSKDEILAFYLNESYYGGMSYGIDAASETYFGKPASTLDLAESALLAGLPQAPAAYDPYTNSQAALDRRSVVLGLMAKAGYISASDRDLAEREPLNLVATPYPMNAPHFSWMVRTQLDALFSQEQIQAAGGVTVRTTLDLDDQHAAENAVSQQLQHLKEKGQSSLGYNVNNAAVVALDPRTGEILAMVGSPDYTDQVTHGAINMALSPRQPGSALKPFIYAAAFDPSRANPWTAATMILDVSAHFVTHDGQPYTPKNYDSVEHGPVFARQALASSLNIPAVLTLQEVGLPTFFKLASQVGISTFGNPDQYDLSLALGGGEVRLIDLTAGYGAFATGGYRVQPYAIDQVTGAQGQVLYQHKAPQPQRVLDERVAWLISDILSDDQARLLGFQANSTLNLGLPAAVKTGTTTNFHDNWTVGYTPNLVVGVWVGNASHDAMREVNGLTGAAPIWHQTMRDILAGQDVQHFIRPAGLHQVEVCALSGMLPTEACPYHRKEWFIDGTEPTRPDTLYQTITLDSQTGRVATAQTPPEKRKVTVVLNLPPSAQTWAHDHGLLLVSDVQQTVAGIRSDRMVPTGNSSDSSQPAVALALQSPAPMTTFMISKTIPLADQRIPIEASAAPDLQQVTLWLDGQPLITFNQAPYRTFWTLQAGNHTVWVQAKTAQGEVVKSQPVSFKVESSTP